MAMDVKDLRKETALSERNNDGSKYSQGGVALQCIRNKSYQDIGSNPLAKNEPAPVRPCAVIGPDRVVPPPASSDAFLKKGPVEPWPCPENVYRRLSDYPHKTSSNLNPSRNISPRQTFQENMQRIMVPPTYSAVRHSDHENLTHVQENNAISKNSKANVAPEPKCCDVPYVINPITNEPKNIRDAEMCVPIVNSPMTRTAPHGWPPSSVNSHAARPYGAHEIYQYSQFPSCAGQRPLVPMTRPHRTLQEETGYVYPEHFYQDANVRFKPYPPIKERYPQVRYEYISNYSSPFHPPLPHKYDIPKSAQPYPYPVYPQLKYLDNRLPDQTMDGYQRQTNPQPHYNIQYRNQVIHPTYPPLTGNSSGKVHPYPHEGSGKTVVSNKLPYDNSNKMYIDYENLRNKTYPMADNYFVNEMAKAHPIKNQMAMPNYSNIGIHPIQSQQYYRKDNLPMKPYEYLPHFRSYEPPMNNNPMMRHAPQFSPNTLAISPTDSSMSNDTTQTHGTQEDCGYASQSSSASVRSVDSGIYRLSNEYYKRYDYKYGPIIANTLTLPKSELNANNVTSKENKQRLDVRQFLQMWNEGEEDNSENNTKDIIIQTSSSDTINLTKQHVGNKDQLYVLGLVNVPSEELDKYEHIQKVSKLPENIKGYNSLELLNQFEEAIESSNTNSFKTAPKEFTMPLKDTTPQLMEPRPVSPLDVEAKISQSVIHKEVGCNFEIRPCSPKMLNVEMAAPAQNILGERLIEKVSNPLSKIVKSPISVKSDDNLNCNKIRRQESSFTISDNPSCKMVGSPYATTNVDPVKTNYTMQDLEINSGVCLASLPRLDNEIELNFPEVNQQFINANKKDSNFSKITESQKMREESLDTNILKVDIEKCDKTHKGEESGKPHTKLSKYRKVKANSTDHSEKNSFTKAVRTDSVIIKNPENIKNIEDKLLENSLSMPINLTSQNYADNGLDEELAMKLRENKDDNDIALDFSLNRAGNGLPIITIENEETTNLIALKLPDISCENDTIIGKLRKPCNRGDTILNNEYSIEPSDPLYAEIETNIENVIKNNQDPKSDAISNIHASVEMINVTTPILHNSNSEKSITDPPEDYAIKCTDQSNKLKADDDKQMSESLEEGSEFITPRGQKRKEECDSPKKNKDTDVLTENINEESSAFNSQSNTLKTDNDQQMVENLRESEGSEFVSSREQKWTIECGSPKPNKDTNVVKQNIINKERSGFDSESDKLTADKNKQMAENVEESEGSEFVSSREQEWTEKCGSPKPNKHTNVLKGNIINEESSTYDSQSDKLTADKEKQMSESLEKSESSDFVSSGEQRWTEGCGSPKANKDTNVFKENIINEESSAFNSLKNKHFVLSMEYDSKNKVIGKYDVKNAASLFESENDFINDEISANLEKMFEESDVPKSPSKNVSKEVIAFTPKKTHQSKELYSPWIQNLLIHKEGRCSINTNDKIISISIEDQRNNVEFNEANKTISPAVMLPELQNLVTDQITCTTVAPNDTYLIKTTNDKYETKSKSDIKRVIDVIDNLNSSSGTDDIKSVIKEDGKPKVEFEGNYSSVDVKPNVQKSTEFELQAVDIYYNGNQIIESNLSDDTFVEKSLKKTVADEIIKIKCENEIDVLKNLESEKSPICCSDAIVQKNESLTDNKNLLINCDSVTVAESGIAVKSELCENKSVSLCDKLQTEDHSGSKVENISDCVSDISTQHQTEVDNLGIDKNTKTDLVNMVIWEQNYLKQNESNNVNLGYVYENCIEVQTEKKQNDENLLENTMSNCGDSFTVVPSEMYHDDQSFPNDNKIEENVSDNIVESGVFEKKFEHQMEKDKLAIDSGDDIETNSDLVTIQREESHPGQNENIQQSNVENHDSDNLDELVKKDYLIKSKLRLKRSYSDSALNNYNNGEGCDKHDIGNMPLIWPSKRKRIYEFNTPEQNVLTENLCNILQNNRRNSISSFYNEENVSFCILIDNDCIITEENEEEKICFAEISEDCIAEINTTNEEENVDESTEYIPHENIFSESVIEYEQEKSIDESWVDDVACVETVITDDVDISVPSSPKDEEDMSECNESGIFGCRVNTSADELQFVYEESLVDDDDQIRRTLYKSPHERITEIFASNEFCDSELDDRLCKSECLENRLLESSSPECLKSPTSDYTNSIYLSNGTENSTFPEDDIFVKNITPQNDEKSPHYSSIKMRNDQIDFRENIAQIETAIKLISDDVVHSCESSTDNVFNYKQRAEDAIYTTSSSPEVSSTTSEEKNSSILLKITNYNGSRVSQINEINSDHNNKPRCKFTEKKDYSNSTSSFPNRPLITKAAQKYIPPIKESIRDLKVKLSLPQQSLLKLKQLKLSRNERKVHKQNNVKSVIPKKPKPNFEDVLKSIDEVQIKMHKEKSKKVKNIVPKVVIKKNQNGSHYTSSLNKETFNPDLTGRKWQPWVFLEKNHFIDKMAAKKKTKAIFNHRKNTYVLAEKFKKYKSVSSTKFVISQPKTNDSSSKGQLKYTIRLKHTY